MKKIIPAFKEHKEFEKKRPWDVNTMLFPTDIVTPPHYAETIEILLCCNIKGTVFIGGNKFELGGKQTFFIAPNVIHSMQYHKNLGTLINIKLHPNNLAPLINLPNILAEENIEFASLPCCLSEYDQLASLAEELRHSHSETIDTLTTILRIFQILLQYSSTDGLRQSHLPLMDASLHEIISWTEQHFTEKISLDEIAKKTGYNKNYFCSKFKAATGETYLQYLNHLRIFHACKLLKNGSSISHTCYSCGFENMSYFIQLFRKIVGTTPKKYVSAQLT